MSDRIEISAYDSTGKLEVSRVINGVLNQKMILGSDKQRRKIDYAWQQKAIDLLNAPSAGVVNLLPGIPIRQLPALDQANLKIAELEFELNNIKEFIKSDDLEEDERTL